MSRKKFKGFLYNTKMARCIFCLDDKEKLTDEHIIYAALVGNSVLRNASCEACQTQCNRSFEQRFLKGENFVAMLRAHLGIKGRRNEPVFGFDRHGHPLTVQIQPGFPPIRVGIAATGIERPMQVILTDEQRVPISHYFLPNEIKRPILAEHFDAIVENVSTEAKFAAFWADGDAIAANPWRELLEAFVAWANKKNIVPIASSIAAGEARVEFTLDWNVEYRNRGITKMCFMYALSKMGNASWFSSTFEPTRAYILKGTPHPSDFWRHAPIVQWNGPHPGQNTLKDHHFTYLIATITMNDCLYGLIQLHDMGLYAVKLSACIDAPLCPDSLSTYLLEKNGEGAYSLKTIDLPEDETTAFAEAVRLASQL